MKKILAAHLSPHVQMTEEDVFKALELPRDTSMGDLAFPCFPLAKSLRKAPPAIAAELSKSLANKLPEGFQRVQNLSGYLNFFFDPQYWSRQLVSEIQSKKDAVGDNLEVGKGQHIVIDYSSPNVAKPMSIGHLRSSVIGQSLVNIFKSMGFKTTGINYLGDWGVQFGKLAWAHLNRDELLKRATSLQKQILENGFNTQLWTKLLNDIQKAPDTSFDYLYALYVVFHACSEIDTELDEYGRQYFVRLERRNEPAFMNDPLNQKIEKAWEKFVEISISETKHVYELLNIKHDLVRGESFHEKDLPGVVKQLQQKGLLKLSDGAQIVDLTAYDMPPCLIQKTDGATLYATRDIAAAIYRHDDLKADRLIYVVGAEQSLHFKQFLKVLELMGFSWAKDCVHVAFGLYRFKEGKMSTRRGNVVFLEDVLYRAIDLVRQIIKEKNPALKDAEAVAKSVGTAAVAFNDLMNDRQKNIDFDWDRILDFNGDTGPYVQYTHVRCCSVLAKWNKPIPPVQTLAGPTEKQEKEVLRVLGNFDDVVRLAYEQLKPNFIAHYLLELAKAFNAFYYEHRILEGEDSTQKYRVALTDSTRIVLKKGLTLLGIRAPESM